jgi:uncharacterized protein (TIGR03435 family)
MNPSNLVLALTVGLLCGGSTIAMEQCLPPQDRPLHRPPLKPDFPPSYEVHISPTTLEVGTSGSSAPDYWSMQGFDLKTLIARAYGFDASRVDFPDTVAAKKRYDMALVLPKEESQETMDRLVQEALRQHFNLTITPESRSMDVYVMTAPNGPGAGLHELHSLGGFMGTTFEWNSPDGRPPTAEDLEQMMDRLKASSEITVSAIAASDGTVADLCRTLEEGLDRPVVDETHITGQYDFEIKRGDRNKSEFFEMLRENFGLVITPDRRDVEVLAVRPLW